MEPLHEARISTSAFGASGLAPPGRLIAAPMTLATTVPATVATDRVGRVRPENLLKLVDMPVDQVIAVPHGRADLPQIEHPALDLCQHVVGGGELGPFSRSSGSIPLKKGEHLGALVENSLPDPTANDLPSAPGIAKHVGLNADERGRLLLGKCQPTVKPRPVVLNPFHHFGDD